MLDLSNFLKQNPQFVQLGAPETILAAINAKSIERKINEPQSFRAVVLRHGITFANGVLAALDVASGTNPILKATYMAICTTGIDFANPQVRDEIDQLHVAGLWSAEDAIKLKAMGVYTISPVEQFFGEGQVADLAAVVTGLAVVDRLTLLAKVTEKYNNLSIAIRSNAVSSWAEAKAFFDAD